jgi:hypothetical protein
MSRRGSIIALSFYALAAVADAGWHLREDTLAGQDWRAIDNLAVAVSAGLFWPADLVARVLLGR